MIKNKLLEERYYINKFPLYMRKNNINLTQIKPFYKTLIELDETCDKILQCINLWNIEKFDEDGNNGWTNFKIVHILADNFYGGDVATALNSKDLKQLDLIAKLYKVKRNFTINDEQFSLTNQELMLLIMFKSAQTSFDGTNEFMQNIYKKLRLPILSKTTGALEMHNYIDTEVLAEDDYFGLASTNVARMFNLGLLSFYPLGIVVTNGSYIPPAPVTTEAEYDSDDEGKSYDYGEYDE